MSSRRMKQPDKPAATLQPPVAKFQPTPLLSPLQTAVLARRAWRCPAWVSGSSRAKTYGNDSSLRILGILSACAARC